MSDYQKTQRTQTSVKLLKQKLRQVDGNHYSSQTVQPIDYILGNELGFCEGNVIKYVTRHKLKGGRQDLEKAIHYLELLIENDYSSKS